MAYTGINKAETVRNNYLTKANGAINLGSIAAQAAVSIGTDIYEEKQRVTLQNLTNQTAVDADKAVSEIKRNNKTEDWEKLINEYYDKQLSDVKASKEYSSTVKRGFSEYVGNAKTNALKTANADAIAQDARANDAAFQVNLSSLYQAPDTVSFLKQNGIISEKGSVREPEKQDSSLESGFISDTSKPQLDFSTQEKGDWQESVSVHSPELQKLYESGADDYTMRVASAAYFAKRRYPGDTKMQQAFIKDAVTQINEKQPYRDLDVIFDSTFKNVPASQWDYGGFMESYRNQLANATYGGVKLTDTQQIALEKEATTKFTSLYKSRSLETEQKFASSVGPELNKAMATSKPFTTDELSDTLSKAGLGDYAYFFPDNYYAYLQYAHNSEQDGYMEQYYQSVMGGDPPEVTRDIIANLDPQNKAKMDENIQKAKADIHKAEEAADNQKLEALAGYASEPQTEASGTVGANHTAVEETEPQTEEAESGQDETATGTDQAEESGRKAPVRDALYVVANNLDIPQDERAYIISQHRGELGKGQYEELMKQAGYGSIASGQEAADGYQTKQDKKTLLYEMERAYLFDIGQSVYPTVDRHDPDYAFLSPSEKDKTRQEESRNAYQTSKDTIEKLRNKIGESEYKKVQSDFDAWKKRYIVPRTSPFATEDNPSVVGRINTMLLSAESYTNDELQAYVNLNRAYLTEDTYKKYNDAGYYDKFRSSSFITGRDTLDSALKTKLGDPFWLMNRSSFMGEYAAQCAASPQTPPEQIAGKMLKQYQEEASYRKVDALFNIMDSDKILKFDTILGKASDSGQFLKDYENGIIQTFITPSLPGFYDSLTSLYGEDPMKLSDTELDNAILGYFLGIPYSKDNADYAKQIKNAYADADDMVKNIVAKQSLYAKMSISAARAYDVELEGITGTRGQPFLTPTGPGMRTESGLVAALTVGDGNKRTWTLYKTKTYTDKDGNKSEGVDMDGAVVITQGDLSNLQAGKHITDGIKAYAQSLYLDGYTEEQVKDEIAKQVESVNAGKYGSLKFRMYTGNVRKQEELYGSVANSIEKQLLTLQGWGERFRRKGYKITFDLDTYRKTGNIDDLVTFGEER
jgi:hypothetical protein